MACGVDASGDEEALGLPALAFFVFLLLASTVVAGAAFLGPRPFGARAVERPENWSASSHRTSSLCTGGPAWSREASTSLSSKWSPSPRNFCEEKTRPSAEDKHTSCLMTAR